MITVRKAQDRGHANHGWLNSYHSFSFANYYDPEHMGYSVLRVINDDTVAPGGGFGTHPHENMEIISYVIEGQLEHKDSMGNGSVIKAGDVQRMSAGTGITHSEYNPSSTEPVHFLQIWILPAQHGGEPGYEQIQVSAQDKRARLRLIASGQATDGAVTVRQDIALYASLLQDNENLEYTVPTGRRAWLQVVSGALSLNGRALDTGDGAQISEAEPLMISAASSSEFLLFDLPEITSNTA